MTYRYNKLSKLKSKFQLKIKYKSMKDSHIARRDDDNPVVFMRCYRRANEAEASESWCGRRAVGGGSWRCRSESSERERTGARDVFLDKAITSVGHP
jgi:hypothetical protein